MRQNLWDLRFLRLASEVATYSKDQSTKVGAIIIDEKRRIVSCGYNGPPKGINDKYSSREEKLLITIHAEINAVLFAQRDLSNCTIYISLPPCAQCASVIAQVGITRVVFNNATPDKYSRWAESFERAITTFKEASIEAIGFD